MIGNEGNGLSDEIADLADTYIKNSNVWTGGIFKCCHFSIAFDV